MGCIEAHWDNIEGKFAWETGIPNTQLRDRKITAVSKHLEVAAAKTMNKKALRKHIAMSKRPAAPILKRPAMSKRPSSAAIDEVEEPAPKSANITNVPKHSKGKRWHI